MSISTAHSTISCSEPRQQESIQVVFDADGNPVPENVLQVITNSIVDAVPLLPANTSILQTLLTEMTTPIDLTDLQPDIVTTVTGKINDMQLPIVVDSGCGHVVISLKLAKILGLELRSSNFAINTASNTSGTVAWLTPVIKITLGPLQFITPAMIVDSPNFYVLLGHSWLQRTKAMLDYDNLQLRIKDTTIPMHRQSLYSVARLSMSAMIASFVTPSNSQFKVYRVSDKA
ncbi:hypothetical protein FB639_005582, partial [Coemansia asiatica]